MKICLDLDGVITDWSGGLCKLLDINPWTPETQKILRSNYMIEGGEFGPIERIDSAVQEAGYDFWINLELLPWAHDLVNLCNKYGEVIFLTSPGAFHAGAHAKPDYILKHFNSRAYVLTEYKSLCARSDRILIDDMQKNIDMWKAHDGIPFRWPCQWRLLEDPELVKEAMEKLEECLESTSRIITSVAISEEYKKRIKNWQKGI
jgi:hypothetical protein